MSVVLVVASLTAEPSSLPQAPFGNSIIGVCHFLIDLKTLNIKDGCPLFIYLLFCFYVYPYFACMCVYDCICAWVPVEAKRG